MKSMTVLLTLAFAAMLLAVVLAPSAESRLPGKTRQERFRHDGVLRSEDPARLADVTTFQQPSGPGNNGPTEAPTGFDNLTNGFSPQGPAFEMLTEQNVVASRSFNDNRFIFEHVETIADGIGPTYNAQSCRECHQNVVTGGASQVTVQRTGRIVNGAYFDSLGGSLIHSRATHPGIVEQVNAADTIRTFRVSPATLGDGFIECISNETLLAIRDHQSPDLRGLAVLVPVLESNGQARLGRFGWKNQHASLVSFSADAYLNEMGITNPLFPEENTSSGRFVGYGSPYDAVPEVEDNGDDVMAFADFMRSTKAPSRGPITRDVQKGEAIFNQIGCASCHTATIITARPGVKVNGGMFTVPPALGDKIIHPYSDFLLHNIGTGDGIPILPTGIRRDRKPDADRPALGAADTEPADARWAIVHDRGSDPAPRGAGKISDEPVQVADAPAEKPDAIIPRIALTSH